MNKSTLMDLPVAQACGAVRHDWFFKTDSAAQESIKELTELVKAQGADVMLAREYPDTAAKNVIVNIVEGKPYVIDGNRHCVALLMAEPKLSFGELEKLRPGLLRVWQAGVEEGKNTPETAYDVYIPADVDISGIPGARRGMDYFKNPPAPTNIVPGSFPSDSELLPEADRGRALGETAAALREMLYGCESAPAPVYNTGGGYGGATVTLPYTTEGGSVYIDTIRGDLLHADEDFRGVLSMPVVFHGNRIVSVGTDAFNRRKGLTGVNFSDSVTFIGNAAFYGCDGLSVVTLPPRLEYLGDDAFGSCVGLLSVIFPGSCKAGVNIGGGAFARCEKLTSVTCLGDIAHIGSGAFYDCAKLMSITLNGAVGAIGAHAFSGCGCLTSISLRAGLQSIGEGAFDRCENLCRVDFRGSREQWEQISVGPGNEALKKAEICLFDSPEA